MRRYNEIANEDLARFYAYFATDDIDDESKINQFCEKIFSWFDCADSAYDACWFYAGKTLSEAYGTWSTVAGFSPWCQQSAESDWRRRKKGAPEQGMKNHDMIFSMGNLSDANWQIDKEESIFFFDPPSDCFDQEEFDAAKLFFDGHENLIDDGDNMLFYLRDPSPVAATRDMKDAAIRILRRDLKRGGMWILIRIVWGIGRV